MTTENLKRAMYYDLQCLRAQKKHPLLLARFEGTLEAYLEALRVEREGDVMVAAELIEYRELLRDAYDRQKQLTQSACASYRELEDEYREVRTDKQHLENANEQGYAKLQEVTAKLASQTETVESLHKAVKDYQKLLAASQEVSANWEFHWDCAVCAREEGRKLILKQRNHIEKLTFELACARKHIEKLTFWMFWKRKSAKDQAAQKKMK